jgi:hypothetical protein
VYIIDTPQIFEPLIICNHVCSYKTLSSKCSTPAIQVNIFIMHTYAQHKIRYTKRRCDPQQRKRPEDKNHVNYYNLFAEVTGKKITSVNY